MGRFGLSFVPLSRPLNKINTDGKCLVFDLAKPNLQMSLPKETEKELKAFFFDGPRLNRDKDPAP